MTWDLREASHGDPIKGRCCISHAAPSAKPGGNQRVTLARALLDAYARVATHYVGMIT